MSSKKIDIKTEKERDLTLIVLFGSIKRPFSKEIPNDDTACYTGRFSGPNDCFAAHSGLYPSICGMLFGQWRRDRHSG
jgi:hypothetical protein